MNRIEHLLTVLMEECSELAIEFTELLGLENNDGFINVTNFNKIQTEYNDLLAAIELLNAETVFHIDMELYERSDRGHFISNGVGDSFESFKKLVLHIAQACNTLSTYASKTKRFGINSDYAGVTNHDLIKRECSFIMIAIQMLNTMTHTFGQEITLKRELIDKKKDKVEKFLTYSKECGTYQD